MDSILEEMNQMHVELTTEREILDIEADFQSHAVKEVQVVSWGKAIRHLEAKIESQGKNKDAKHFTKSITIQVGDKPIKIWWMQSVNRRETLEEFSRLKEQQNDIRHGRK
ncbi:hypothetical protein CEXT_557751 [Caerostris extrusa]|uniref:Uncharacterized protein n=1 Tax=Caerostris extrusa TaxID=172846 RepID=A0AAV4R9I9_CAEEX|nr:hypothetical protein CEXT_557751 [Caerostris extrusa]